MKKGLVVIFAVAILGALGMFVNKNKSSVSTSNLAGQTVSASPSSATQASSNTSSSSQTSASYKDGTFQGNSADTPYGTVQIAVVINGGKITDVKFLQMPDSHGHSVEISNAAAPLLKQIAIEKQSPNIDFVSGATSTSYGFQESLQAALDAAALKS
jgi:uncharacterized protein with FMN-binding domain